MLKIGDKVKANELALDTKSFWGLEKDKVYVVKKHFGGPVVFNRDNEGGWINESMGLNKYFKLASSIHLGGE